MENAEAAVDEEVAERVLGSFPQPPMVPEFYVAEKEREECVRRAMEQLRGEAGVGSHAEYATKRDTKEGETSVSDIRDGIDLEAGCESEGFTIADKLQRAVL